YFTFHPPPTPTISTLSLHDALPISHALTTDLGQRDFHAAAVADHAAIADALVLAAMTLPVLDRTEDALAEETVLLGLERAVIDRSEEHTSELQSLRHLVCRLLLEKK